MDTEHWLLRERVVEAVALVESVCAGVAAPPGESLAELAHLRAELAALVRVVCDDDADAAEACDAGCGAIAAIDEALAQEWLPLPTRSAA